MKITMKYPVIIMKIAMKNIQREMVYDNIRESYDKVISH